MKKLKQQYRHYAKQKKFDYIWNRYPNVRSGMHKVFSTKQEKSYYYMHLIECRGYPIKLRAARGGELADPWEDYPSYVYSVAKSWKHNSNRRSQFYK